MDEKKLNDQELNNVDGGMWINGMRPAGMFEGNTMFEGSHVEYQTVEDDKLLPPVD